MAQIWLSIPWTKTTQLPCVRKFAQVWLSAFLLPFENLCNYITKSFKSADLSKVLVADKCIPLKQNTPFSSPLEILTKDQTFKSVTLLIIWCSKHLFKVYYSVLATTLFRAEWTLFHIFHILEKRNESYRKMTDKSSI